MGTCPCNYVIPIISQRPRCNVQERRAFALLPPLEQDFLRHAKEFGCVGSLHEFWTDTEAGQLVSQKADGFAQCAHFFYEVQQRNPPIKLR